MSFTSLQTPRRPSRRLTRLDPTEISLVDAPANLRKFIVTKRAQMPNNPTEDVLSRMAKPGSAADQKIAAFLAKSQVRKDAEGEEELALSPSGSAALKAIGRILAPYAGEITEAHMMGLMGELGLMPPVSTEGGEGEQDEQAVAEAAQAESEGEGEDATAPQAEGEAEGESDPDLQLTRPDAVRQEDHDKALAEATEVYKQHIGEGAEPEAAHAAAKDVYLKALDAAGYTVSKRSPPAEDKMPPQDSFTPAQRAQIETMLSAKIDSLRQENKTLVQKSAKLEADLAVEREDRLEREYAKKAAAYAALGSQGEVVALLKAAHGNPEQQGKLEAVLKSACAQVQSGSGQAGLFGELGSRLENPASGPEAELEQLVTGLVEKAADDKSTPAQRYTRVLKTQRGRELYNKAHKPRSL